MTIKAKSKSKIFLDSQHTIWDSLHKHHKIGL